MKWIILFIYIMLPIPVANWLHIAKRNYRIAAFVIGILPFLLSELHLTIAPYSWARWPGYVKGIELTLLDIVAISILIATAKDRVKAIFLLPFLPYFLAALLSIFMAENPQVATFYCWQLMRVALVSWAVAKLIVQIGNADTLILGLMAGTAYEAYVAVTQFLHGAAQSSGTFGHQNFLGMVTHFELYPTLALLLGRTSRPIQWLGLAAGLGVIVLTASRATIGLAGLAVVLTLILSGMMRWTPRKGMFVGGAMLFALLAVPLAIRSLDRRTSEQKEGSSQERIQFENAARYMIADHPLGVGANEYVVMANTRGYSDRAGVSWQSTERGANVHNSYLLTNAELGWFGLVSMVGFFSSTIVLSFTALKRYRADRDFAVFPGLVVVLLAVFVQAAFEWVFLTYNIQYLLAMTLGAITGLVELARRRKGRPRDRRKIEAF